MGADEVDDLLGFSNGVNSPRELADILQQQVQAMSHTSQAVDVLIDLVDDGTCLDASRCAVRAHNEHILDTDLLNPLQERTYLIVLPG